LPVVGVEGLYERASADVRVSANAPAIHPEGNASAAPFVGGDSGSTLQVSDYAAAQNALSSWILDAVALCNCTDSPTLD
jgi:hypothetical protein